MIEEMKVASVQGTRHIIVKYVTGTFHLRMVFPNIRKNINRVVSMDAPFLLTHCSSRNISPCSTVVVCIRK